LPREWDTSNLGILKETGDPREERTGSLSGDVSGVRRTAAREGAAEREGCQWLT